MSRVRTDDIASRAALNSVFQTCALRRDHLGFYKTLVALPRLARSSLKAAGASFDRDTFRYHLRYFNEVLFCDHYDFVVHGHVLGTTKCSNHAALQRKFRMDIYGMLEKMSAQEEYGVEVQWFFSFNFKLPSYFVLHRFDGPALEVAGGGSRWYSGNVLHRLGGPAIYFPERAFFHVAWYVDGVQHRLDGPALICESSFQWFVHGQLHRADGPAALYSYNCFDWYHAGQTVCCEEINHGGDFEEWWYEGKLHRTGGPAVYNGKGSFTTKKEEWWFHGRRHRTNGPAVCRGNTREWWVRGKRHRADGPAIEGPNGKNQWWRHGRRFRADGTTPIPYAFGKFIVERRDKPNSE